MTIHLHHGDLPSNVKFTKSIAVDTETMGLQPVRDRLCLVQISAGDGTAHLIKFDGKDFTAPNLRKVLQDNSILKIFHFARFDIAALMFYLNVAPQPVYCTKIASRLTRTFTDKHGLKELCRDLLGVELSKQQQTSDWGAKDITEEQKAYAASDVLHLHAIKTKLDDMLKREERLDIAEACFNFLITRALLDLQGWDEVDIFAHS